MKKNLAIYTITAIALVLTLVACDKATDVPFYKSGTPVMLTATKTAIAPPAADSDKTVLTLNWTPADYPTSASNVKYTVEIDSTGRFFSREVIIKVLTNSFTTSFTGKELNNILLSYGYAFNVPVDMDVRVTSSYANNNDRLISNTLKIRMTPYKIPPKVALPASGRLFIVGDATTFGWSNDAPPPSFPPEREFSRLNETTWAGIFYMVGGGGYKILQTQGDWDTQFHMLAGGNASGGSFEQRNADPTFPGPSNAGWYKVVLDFQTGKFTTAPVADPLPQELYATGDATAAGWTNSPPDTQKLTRLNSTEYQITLPFVSGKYYKFLSSFGNWQPQFGGTSATGGDLGANYGGGNDPSAIPTPATAGDYRITVNFATNKYSVVQ